ncbi:uncharacterized protein [Dermacentor albipictus]|uniref:uncharacterized protein n=1 Tax=Dermacentor albipictus TaxID=60249 RepID=UPI0038FC9AB4
MANKPATVIPGLQQPPPLDFDKKSEWPAWIDHFDDYRFATALNECSGEAQTPATARRVGGSVRNRTKRLIRDRFVVGLRDVQLSEALQMDPQLTLATALAMARLKETVRQQQSLRPEGVHIGSPPELQDQGAIVDAVGHQKRPQHKKGRCPYCVGDAPPRSTCPAKASKCHYCGNKGHFAKACLKKVGSAQRKVRVWAVEHGPGEAFIGAIDAAGKARYVQVLINSVPILANVDSGAEVSVLPSTFPGLPTHLDNAHEVLQGAGGNKLNVLGKFVAEIAWKQDCPTNVLCR